MISLKKEYNKAKDKAIELMSTGNIKEYILQLQQLNELKLQLKAVAN